VTVDVDEDNAGVRGMEIEAEPVGDILLIFWPTGRQRLDLQVTSSAVPETVNFVAGKKVARGLFMSMVVGVRLGLDIVTVFVGLEDREREMETVRLFLGTMKVAAGLAEVVMVIVSDVSDVLANVRRPV